MPAPKKTEEQKAQERKAKLEKLKTDIESGELKDLSKISKKDKEELIKMGVAITLDTSATADDQSDSSDEEDTVQETDEGSEEDLKTPPVDEPKVKVFSQVHMTCLDGTKLVVGEFAHISKSEYERLKQDARGPFFKE